MLKLLKKAKIYKLLTILLVAVFTINVTSGCEVESNGVNGEQSGGGNANTQLGVGNNIDGYLVYSQSSFDPMSKELLMGYLLNGRNFTLVVVPSTADDGDTDNYDAFDSSNYLFSSAQAGLFQYDDNQGKFINPEYKALMYYATDKQLNSWFKEFEDDDNFLNAARQFSKETIDLKRGSRFKCEDLVNLGSGLNSDAFCNKLLKNEEISFADKNGTTVKRKVFASKTEGGIVLFFGFYSIEGYMTYYDIKNYEGSQVANDLDNCSYTVGNVGAYNFKELAREYLEYLIMDVENGGYGYSETVINKFINGEYDNNPQGIEQLKSDIISLHTEMVLGANTGCIRQKEMYKLLEQSLITDYGKSIKTLKTEAYNAKENSGTSVEDKDKYTLIYETILMLENFKEYAEQEAFNIKFSYGLFNRYSSLINVSNTSNVLGTYNSFTELDSNSEKDFNKVLSLSKGEANANSYLLLITADGFIWDRGTDEDMATLGAADMLGFSDALEQLVIMDGCPNQTLAAKMYNLFANLKISAGIALAVTGASVAVGAAIGLTVASVISKIALVTAATPVPGARIAALVVAGIAGLIALGVGLVTLISGLNDKAKLKGMGASEENYCQTYKATVNKLLIDISLPIPVYSYNIPKDSSDSISLKFCLQGDYNEQSKQCEEDGVGTGEPKEVPLYYYANKVQVEELELEGMPILMYFNNNELVDYISGATTPEFIIEMIRLWGLLAAREIVYKATINGNAIDIYHTANKNARTVKINKLRYCFTLGEDSYEKNLYDDPCADYVDVNLNTNSVNSSRPIKSITITENMKNKVEQSILKSNLGVLSAFKEQMSYKVNTYVNSNFNILESKQEVYEDMNITSISYNGFSGLTISDSISNKEETIKGYLTYNEDYFLKLSSSLEIEAIYSIETDETDDTTTYKIYKVATSKGLQYTTFIADHLKFLSEDTSFTLDHFIEYIAGDYTFKNTISSNITIPLYFTATIKEQTQKTCGDNKYSYNREGTLFGWFDGERCLTDTQVTNNDTPIAGDEKEYSTSIYIGEAILYLDEKGNIVVNKDKLWSSLGGN